MALISASDKAVKKFIAHFEKQGWTLMTRPRVRRVKVQTETEEFKLVPDRTGAKTLAVPVLEGMRADNPFYKPETDQYQVTAWFTRPPRAVQIEIPDQRLTRLIERGKLPAGLVIK